jgi:serine/threonine protein kinase
MRTVRRIDRGGFGYVDEIELTNGSRAARKCFDPLVADPAERNALRRRFEREVRIQTAIHHPNIMPVLEAGLDVDPPWFTMPLASGSLEHKIRADHTLGAFDPMPWPNVLGAVEELHRLGYVHRHLKPANILLVNGTWVVPTSD